jgi:hypothetical protein
LSIHSIVILRISIAYWLLLLAMDWIIFCSFLLLLDNYLWLSWNCWILLIEPQILTWSSLYILWNFLLLNSLNLLIPLPWRKQRRKHRHLSAVGVSESAFSTSPASLSGPWALELREVKGHGQGEKLQLNSCVVAPFLPPDFSCRRVSWVATGYGGCTFFLGQHLPSK